MAINGGNIELGVSYKVDSSGLQSMKKQLTDLYNISPRNFFENSNFDDFEEAKKRLKEIRSTVKDVQIAYDNAFDPTTGIININKLSQSFKELNRQGNVTKAFSDLGIQGTKTLNSLTSQITTVNLKFRETNNFLTKMGETLTNTIKWGIASSAMNTFTGAVQQAYGYVQHLDTSLNDIRIVTGKSADEMDRFAEKANKAAQALGSSTTDYTEASLIYYQQGLNDEETAARAETTIKAANVTGQTAKQVSEELTAVWNGYKVTAEETEAYVDKLAAVAATTASNLEELSTGMSKVASAANNMGVDVDQLNAQLSTIISVTRQAPETAGTALKTIYARMEDLKIDGSDEDGVKLGEVSSTLDEVGVHIMDTEGNMRDLGEVIEEVGNKWEGWTDAQQAAIAQAIAGKRQYNNLLALFDSWDKYNTALETSRNATGTLQKQQDTYMESVGAHIKQLDTEWEDLYKSLLKAEDINSIIDKIVFSLDRVSNVVKGIGGGKTVLFSLMSVLTKIPSITNVISSQLGSILIKSTNAKKNAKEWSEWQQRVRETLPSSQYTEILDKMQKYKLILNEAGEQQIASYITQLKELEDKKRIEQEILDIIIAQVKATSKVQSEENNSEEQQKKDKDVQDLDINKGFLSKKDTDLIEDVLGDERTAYNALEDTIKSYKTEFNNLLDLYKEYDQIINKDTELTEEETKRLEELSNSIGEVGQKLESLKKEGSNSLKVLANSNKKAAEELKESFDTIDDSVDKLDSASDGSELSDAIKDSSKIFEDFKKTSTANLSDIDESLANTTDAFRQTASEYGKTAEDINNTKQEFNEFLDDTKVQNFANGIVNLTGSIAGLASGISSIINLGSIFQNEDLTTGEKLEQTASALTIGISLLVSSIGQLKTGLVELLGPTFANIAAKKGWITTEGVATAKGAKHIKVIEGETAATEAYTIAILKERAAQLIRNPVLVIAAIAIAAVTAKIWLSIKAHEKEIKILKESNDTIIENNKIRTEQIEKNRELSNSLENLIDQYKEGTLSEEDFYNKKAQLLMAMDEESRIALSSAENWKEAQKALTSYRAELVKQEKETSQENAQANFENMLAEGDKGKGKYNPKTRQYTYDWTVYTSDPGIQPIRNYLSKQGYNLDDITKLITTTTEDRHGNKIEQQELHLDINADEDMDTVLAFIEAVQTLQREGFSIPENWWNEVNQWTESEYYQSALQEKATKKAKAEEEAGLESGIDTAQTIEEGKAAYDKFKDTLIKDAGYTLSEVNEAWGKYLSGVDNEIAAQMSQSQINFEKMTYKFSSGFSGVFDETKYAQRAREILEYLENQNLDNGIQLLDEEEWYNLLAGNLSKEEIAQKVSQAIDQNIQNAFETFKETTGEKEDNLQSLIIDAISGSVETGDDSTYALIKSQLEDLLTYYPELEDEVNTFNNESIIGTQKWIDSVYILKDAYNDLEFDKIVENYSNTLDKLHNQLEQLSDYEPQYDEKGNLLNSTKTVYDDRGFATTETEIEIVPDTEQFTETISEIMDADYAVTIEVQGDITDDFNNVVDSMENLDDMASKIGEDFIVSAEDITEIAAAYPGILEGYTDLGNGTIQLNEDIAKSAMNAASQAEIASTEELVTEIENTNAKLKLKKQHYQTIINIAQQAADGEIEAQQAATDISTELDKIEEINDDLKSEEVENNAADVADNSAINAGIVSDNWGQAYDNMASDAIEAAKIAIQSAQAVADNKADEIPENSKVSVTWSGGSKGTSSGINASTSNYKSSSDVTDSDYWQNVIDDAQSQIDALDEQIASNEAMAVEAAARLGNSVTTNSNVGTSTSDDSSSDSSSEAETEEYLEREEDLYQEINDQLDEIEDKLGRIDTIQSHTWGINYANNLKTQNDLLKDQIELLEEKKNTYESDLSNQRSELESQGFTFNESGSSITNQQDVLDELYAEYNSMVDTYNSMTADEQDSYESTLEAKKDAIDEIEDAIDDYNDAYDNYNDTLDELLDAHYELIENEVNSFNANIDVQLELDDAKEEWNDFWYEVIEDVEDTDFGGKIAQSLGKLDTLIGTVGNQSSSEVATLTEHLSLLTDEVNKQISSADRGGEDSMFKDDSALAKETLETYRDDLMDAVRSAKEEIDDMMDTYLDALDDMNDKINDHIDGWKDVGDHIEHNVELIKMVSGEKEYEGIAKQYEQLYQNNLTILDADRRAKEEWESKVKYYKEMLATEQEGTEMYQLYSDALDKAEDNLRDAISRLDSDLIDALKSREEQFKNSAASISDALDKALSGGMGLDRMKNEWDLAVEDQEHYLDNVERSFNMDELDDIFTDILDSMEGRNDLQQEFLKFQDEEIDKLNQRERLTQYDIDELKARLEIKKQELALEEAQQNKSNLRLRRDSQGNYNYQYVANEDDIEDAENNVLTAKKDWYELVKKRNVETAEAVMDIRSRMAQAEQDMADATLAHDEDAWNKAHDTYITLQDRMKEYMGDAEKAKQDFFKGTADFFSDVENNTILPMWDTTVEHLIDQWSGGGESSFIGSTTAAINELEAEQEKFSNDTTTLLNTAGVAYDELVKTGIDPTTEALEELNDTNEELNDYLEEQDDLFGDLEDSIRDAVDAYNDLEDAAVSALEAANTALTTLAETAITAVEEVSNAVTTANNAADSVRSGGSNGTGSNGSSSTTTTSKEYEAVPDPYGVAGNYAVRKKGSSNNKYIVIGTKDYLKKLGWTSNNVEGLKTGGYTGEWMKGLPDADNGRLAILHQKELVLNEADTTNILNAVDTMRDIVGTGHNNLEFNSLADSITASARMTAGVLSQIGTGMLSAISSMVNNNNSEIQNYRNMTVNADFSGVRSADAIYQALMELDNYGSQQAYSNSPTAIKRY